MTARRPSLLPAALLPAALLSAALLGAACSDHGPLVPEGDAPTGAVSGGTGRPDSTGTATPLPTSVRAYGRILAVSLVTPQPGSADSLRFAPVPNARIQLVRNVLENGAAVQKLARELTADASGAWSASGLEGGYYIVKAAAPAGSGLKDGWEYLPATQAEVKRDVYLWADR